MADPIASSHTIMVTTPTTETPAEQCAAIQVFLGKFNAVAIATSVSGGVAFIGCAAVGVVIYAHNRDLRSLANRVLLGVFGANGVFAAALVVPFSLHYTSGPDCGDRVVGTQLTNIPGNCLPGACVYGGLYASACFELLMVAVSIAALRSGSSNIPRSVEVTAHTVRCTAALLGGRWT